MNNSSAQEDCLTISNDGAVSGSYGFIAQEIDSVLTDTITLTSGTGSSYYYTAGVGGIGTIAISGSGSASGYTIASGSTVTINDVNTTSFNWKMPEEFIDAFPDYDRVEKMCKEYPGLAIAFEKFKTVYKLVKDDYDTPKDKRPKP
jgi:hypothetical protein